jgi:hypothetical protein
VVSSDRAAAPGKRFRTIKSSNYNINNTCNLTCEGCYYFVSGQKTYNRRPSAIDYDRLFRAEAGRGVNYPIFSGGEPSLNPTALLVAARYWSSGIIYTNGIKKVPAEVPFRIAISVWGNRSRNERLRGADSYQQAFRTATGDPRALIYYTITRLNIDDIEDVVADCVRHGICVSFNDFSMTSEYVRLLKGEPPTGNPFFRLSNKDYNLSLRMQDRLRAADIIDRLIDRHPDHVVFTKTLNDWMHRTPAIHDIDPDTGVATDCAMLNASWHWSYGFDLRRTAGKECCAPEFDCRDCRVGPVATFTLLTRLAERMRHSKAARLPFLDLRELMMRYHYWDWPGAEAARPPAYVNPAVATAWLLSAPEISECCCTIVSSVIRAGAVRHSLTIAKPAAGILACLSLPQRIISLAPAAMRCWRLAILTCGAKWSSACLTILNGARSSIAEVWLVPAPYWGGACSS